MRASPRLKHRTFNATISGFGLFATGVLSVSTRAQDASRTSPDSRDAATRVTAQAAAAASFVTCFAEGLGDVGFCIEGSDPDGSGTCLEGASARFSRCFGSTDAASSDDSANGVEELGLGLMARAAERAFMQMREGDSDLEPGDAAPIVTRTEKTPRRRAGVREEAPTVSAQAERVDLFLSCLSGGTADVRSCADVFTDASDPDGVWICFETASNQFLRCMGSASTAGSDASVSGVEKLGLGLMASVAERIFQQMPREDFAPVDLLGLDPELSRPRSLADSVPDGLLRPRESVDPSGNAVNAQPEGVDPQISFAVRRPDPRDGGNHTKTNTGYQSPTGSSWGTCGIALCDCPSNAEFPSAVFSSVSLSPLKSWYFPLLNAIYLKLDRCCHLDQTNGTPNDPTDDTRCYIVDSGLGPYRNNCVSTIDHECAHACAAAKYGHALYTVLTALEWIRCGTNRDCHFYEQEADDIDSVSGPFSWNVKVFGACSGGSP